MSSDDAETRRRVSEKTLRWANAAADAGNLVEAVGWLDTHEAVHGLLGPKADQLRVQWQLRLAAEAAPVTPEP